MASSDDIKQVVDLLQKIMRAKPDRWAMQVVSYILLNQYDQVVGNHTPGRRGLLEQIVRELFPEPEPEIIPDEYNWNPGELLTPEGEPLFYATIPPSPLYSETIQVIGSLGDDDCDDRFMVVSPFPDRIILDDELMLPLLTSETMQLAGSPGGDELLQTIRVIGTLGDDDVDHHISNND